MSLVLVLEFSMMILDSVLIIPPLPSIPIISPVIPIYLSQIFSIRHFIVQSQSHGFPVAFHLFTEVSITSFLNPGTTTASPFPSNSSPSRIILARGYLLLTLPVIVHHLYLPVY